MRGCAADRAGLARVLSVGDCELRPQQVRGSRRRTDQHLVAGGLDLPGPSLRVVPGEITGVDGQLDALRLAGFELDAREVAQQLDRSVYRGFGEADVELGDVGTCDVTGLPQICCRS